MYIYCRTKTSVKQGLYYGVEMYTMKFSFNYIDLYRVGTN
jgi:hypothetical protein